MSKQVSDFLIDRIHAWGISRIYGYPGDGINGIMGALNRADGKVEFIQVRHEEMAAFMACGHAKFAYPDRVPIALVGDGAMQMLGNNGLITIAKYWKQWSNPKLIILVLNNQDLNQVTWEQRVMAGDPAYEASQNLPDFPYAAYAEMLGLKGVKVDKPEDVASGWEEVLSADRPAVYEVVVDPNVPTVPPHFTFEQMVKYTKTLIKGDPKQRGIIRQTFKEVIDSIRH